MPGQREKDHSTTIYIRSVGNPRNDLGSNLKERIGTISGKVKSTSTNFRYFYFT